MRNINKCEKPNCNRKNNKKHKNDGCLDIIISLVLIVGGIVLACMLFAAIFKVIGVFIIVGCLFGFFILLCRCK